MIRATWDTNAIASGVIARQGIMAELIDSWRRGDFEMIVSEHILTELGRTLRKPYFRARLTENDREELVALIRSQAVIAALGGSIPNVLPDPADNVVLATAIRGAAAYVVTGDRAMQSLGAFQGVQIVSPRAFLALLVDHATM